MDYLNKNNLIVESVKGNKGNLFFSFVGIDPAKPKSSPKIKVRTERRNKREEVNAIGKVYSVKGHSKRRKK